jgi:peptide/nickel transport system substrate-binding protein
MKRALILVSMLTLLFAAGLASEPECFIVECNGKPGGTLSVDGIDPRSLNPAFGNDGASLNILKFIVESLLDENEFGFPEHPALCKDWWISEDGFTLCFVIRRPSVVRWTTIHY